MQENVPMMNPCDLDAEKSILSAMINDKDSILEAIDKLEESDFYKQEHSMIYGAIIALFNENVLVDLVVLKSKLDDLFPTASIDIAFISDIASNVILVQNIREYIKIVKDKSILRKIIKTNREILGLCYKREENAENILDKVQKNVFDILNNRNSSDYVHVREVLASAFDKIEEVYRNKGKIVGIPTGFFELDHKTAGLQPSDMILIAARPSMGKTSFAINIVENVAIKNNIPTAIFSLEMSKEQITSKILSGYSMIDSQRMRTGELSEKDFIKMADAMEPIANAPIYIDDTPGITVTELRAKCRRLKIEKGIKLVVLDYLQLMNGTKSGSDSRQQEISEISRNIKAIAREIGAPIIALSQLSRACEARVDHRPMLSDLRESGAIEQDADVVMFIYRDEYYNPMSEKKNEAEIIIAKHRNGPTGTINLMWLNNYTKFVNMQKGE